MRKVCMGLLLFVIAVSPVFAAGEVEASADSYPNRSILMVVPFGAGGATDQLARITQKVMGTGARATICRSEHGRWWNLYRNPVPDGSET